MKTLILAAAVLLTGCATTKTPPSDVDARVMLQQRKSHEIAVREQQCIDETETRSNDQVARIAAASDPDEEMLMQKANDERDRELYQCRTAADRENDELTSSERAQYQDDVQDERDRSALMMILTTSSPR